MGFYVICPEFTGHGHSDHSSSWSHHQGAADICDVADALKITQFHLVGHSMGGIVACLVAGSVIPRVLSLVLLDTIGAVGMMDDLEAPELLERHLNERSRILSRKPRLYETLDECVAKWTESPFAPRGAENVRLLVERGTEEVYDCINNTSGYRFRHDPRLRSPPAFKLTEKSSLAFMSRIPCPVLVFLATDREPFWPEEAARTHFEALRATLINIQGGHHMHMTYPQEVADHILHFYQERSVLAPPKSRL